MNPSEHLDDEWLYAYHAESYDDQYLNHMGRWLLFFSRQFIDEWWEKVKAATEAGELGPMSKVSTAGFARGARQVVQVYTRDAEDEEDVMRVRERLRELGVIWQATYKDVEGVGTRYHV